MAEIRSTDDVNDLAKWLPELIRGDFRMNPASYLKLASDYDGANSKNWDEVACAADFIALVHGNPTSHPVSTLLSFLDMKLNRLDYFRGEGSILTKVYTRHIWPPTLIVYAACIVLSKRGDKRFEPYIEPLRQWLRALFGFALPCTQNVRSRSMTQAQIDAPPKPGVVVANSTPNESYPPISAGAVGRRSWDGDFTSGAANRGWFWGIAPHISSAYLAEYGLGLEMSKVEKYGIAIRQAWKVDTTLTTKEERARMLNAINNDSIEDLDWEVKEMCGKYTSMDPVTVYRFADSSTSVLESTKGGPTNSIAAWNQWKSGKAEMMSPTSGHRGSSTEGLSSIIDLAKRTVTATGEKFGNVVTLQMSTAPLIWAYRWPGDSQPGVRVYPEVVMEPPVEPGVTFVIPVATVEVETKNCVQRFIERIIIRIKELI